MYVTDTPMMYPDKQVLAHTFVRYLHYFHKNKINLRDYSYETLVNLSKELLDYQPSIMRDRQTVLFYKHTCLECHIHNTGVVSIVPYANSCIHCAHLQPFTSHPPFQDFEGDYNSYRITHIRAEEQYANPMSLVFELLPIDVQCLVAEALYLLDTDPIKVDNGDVPCYDASTHTKEHP